MTNANDMRKLINLLNEGWNDHVGGPGYDQVYEVEAKIRDLPVASTLDNRQIEDLAHFLVHDEELDSDTFQTVFDYYLNNGEMPYGVAKARTGDPYNWIHARLESELNLSEGIAMAAAKATKPVVDTINKVGSAIKQGITKDDDDMEEACGKKHKRMKETAPKGWEKTVIAMKDEPEIDNPYALTNWMKKKGYKSRKK